MGLRTATLSISSAYTNPGAAFAKVVANYLRESIAIAFGSCTLTVATDTATEYRAYMDVKGLNLVVSGTNYSTSQTSNGIEISLSETQYKSDVYRMGVKCTDGATNCNVRFYFNENSILFSISKTNTSTFSSYLLITQLKDRGTNNIKVCSYLGDILSNVPYNALYSLYCVKDEEYIDMYDSQESQSGSRIVISDFTTKDGSMVALGLNAISKCSIGRIFESAQSNYLLTLGSFAIPYDRG